LRYPLRLTIVDSRCAQRPILRDFDALTRKSMHTAASVVEAVFYPSKRCSVLTLIMHKSG